MKTVVVKDPFTLNISKLAFFHQVVDLLYKHFPGHQTSSTSLRSGFYLYFSGNPSISKINSNITVIHFGVLTPTPPDTRRSYLGIHFEEAPEPEVIAAISITYQEEANFVSDFTISVFGIEHKGKFQEFINEVANIDPKNVTNSLFLNVKSEFPLRLNSHA